MENLKEFIFENKPTDSCHASTVLPLDDGRVVAAWFAGTKESADDVDILTSVRSESGWRSGSARTEISRTGTRCFFDVRMGR